MQDRDVGKIPYGDGEASCQIGQGVEPAGKLESPGGRLSDAGTFHRARMRGQATFTLVAQDRSSPRLVVEWIKENIETCPPAKLYEALSRAIQMREHHYRKAAD